VNTLAQTAGLPVNPCIVVLSPQGVSDGVDYGYAARDGSAVVIQAVVIPDELAERCLSLARTCGLVVCGIDLRLAPGGRWYCFEVNPSPGFTYYQASTGHAIDRAIARVLTGGRRR